MKKTAKVAWLNQIERNDPDAGGAVRKKLVILTILTLAIGAILLPGCKKAKRSGFTASAQSAPVSQEAN